MKGIDSLVAGLLVLALGCLLGSCAATQPGAVMVFETDSISVGTMRTGSDAVREVSFDFRNAGRETLRISQVRVSCDCMKVEVDPMEVPSRGKGRVKVVLNLTNAYPMDIDKTIGIYSNDANSPAVLRLTGVLLDRNY